MSPASFGAEVHRYLLKPPLSAEEVSGFERRYHITLPDDYRWFITTVANGGAGPYYGLFPLGEMDFLGYGQHPWKENDSYVGRLSAQFPWPNVSGTLRQAIGGAPNVSIRPTDLSTENDDGDSREQVDGAIPIYHMGCGYYVWLVVTGPEAGFLWEDYRASDEGFMPASLYGRRVTFLEYYDRWLHRSLGFFLRIVAHLISRRDS